MEITMDEKAKVTRAEKFYNALLILLACLGVGIMLYIVFASSSLELEKQAVLWFFASVVCIAIPALAPHIRTVALKTAAGEVLLDFKREIAELKQISDSLVLSQVFEYLESDGKVSNDQKLELERLIRKAPRKARNAIFAVASSMREEMINEIISQKSARSQQKNREELKKFVPIFKALIEAEEENPYIHHYKAQLAYVYKDQWTPDGKERDYSDAYNAIQDAIDHREKQNLENMPYTIYEFNRLILGLCVGKRCPPEQLKEDFAKVYEKTETRYMLFTTKDVIAPKLSEWIDKDEEKKKLRDAFLGKTIS
jgi:hypothetical protein